MFKIRTKMTLCDAYFDRLKGKCAIKQKHCGMFKYSFLFIESSSVNPSAPIYYSLYIEMGQSIRCSKYMCIMQNKPSISMNKYMGKLQTHCIVFTAHFDRLIVSLRMCLFVKPM